MYIELDMPNNITNMELLNALFPSLKIYEGHKFIHFAPNSHKGPVISINKQFAYDEYKEDI